MANFSALKTAIQNAIKQNGNEEITGDVLQQILLSIVNTMGDGAINTIEQNLSSETLARQSADNTLQQNIDAEAGARQSADNSLQSNIDAEALARGNADTQLQNAINAIKSDIDNGFVYAGIATPTTVPVSGKVFYIAIAAGTYTNFGGQVLTQGINILRYNGSAWSNQQLIGIDDVPTAGSNNLVKSGGVQNELALGAVYDVSAKNPIGGPNNDGKWESLSALLSDANLNTLIPTAYRKGGMSIKFAHTSDNKYVQYRLMSDSFNTTVANWQGVDTDVIIRSKNLVESGGVAKAIEDTAMYGSDINFTNELNVGKIIDLTNAAVGNVYLPVIKAAGGYSYRIVPCKQGDYFICTTRSNTASAKAYAILDSSGNVLQLRQDTMTNLRVACPENSAFIIINTFINNVEYSVIKYTSVNSVTNKVENNVDSLKLQTSDFQDVASLIEDKFIVINSNTIGDIVTTTVVATGSLHWKYWDIQCAEGDELLLTTKANTSGAKSYVVLDSNNMLLAYSDSPVTNKTIKCPERTARVLVNTNTLYEYVVKKREKIDLDSLVQDVEILKEQSEVVIQNSTDIGVIKSDQYDYEDFMLLDDNYMEVTSNNEIGSVCTITKSYNANYISGIFDCKEGDVFIISTKTTTASVRACIIVDANDKVLYRTNEPASTTFNNLVITCPANSNRIIFNSNYKNGILTFKKRIPLADDVIKENNPVSKNNYVTKTRNLFIRNEYTKGVNTFFGYKYDTSSSKYVAQIGYFFAEDGSVYNWASRDKWGITSFLDSVSLPIAIKPSTTYKFDHAENSPGKVIRCMITEFDSNDIIVGTKTGVNAGTYTTKENGAYVRLSFTESQKDDILFFEGDYEMEYDYGQHCLEGLTDVCINNYKVAKLNGLANNYCDAYMKSIANEAMNYVAVNRHTFVWISDTHSHLNIAHFAGIAAALTKLVPSSYIAHTGDIIDGMTTPANGKYLLSLFNQYMMGANCPVYYCKGNHDDNDIYARGGVSGELGLATDYITNKELAIRTLLFNKNKIHGNIDSMYYYVDDELTKIRSIFINSFDNSEEVEDSRRVVDARTEELSNTQYQWLVDTMLFSDMEDSSGWAVCIFAHDVSVITYIRSLIAAFKTGTSYTRNSIVADFSQNGAREFISLFTGDQHIDRLAFNDSICNITLLNASLPADNRNLATQNNSILYSPTKDFATENETAIEIVSIDRENKKIYLTRYGARSYKYNISTEAFDTLAARTRVVDYVNGVYDII